jgi:hypothetical protein
MCHDQPLVHKNWCWFPRCQSPPTPWHHRLDLPKIAPCLLAAISIRNTRRVFRIENATHRIAGLADDGFTSMSWHGWVVAISRRQKNTTRLQATSAFQHYRFLNSHGWQGIRRATCGRHICGFRESGRQQTACTGIVPLRLRCDSNSCVFSFDSDNPNFLSKL